MAARDLASSSSRAGAAGAAESAECPGSAPGLAARYRSLFVIGRGGMGTVEAALELHGDGTEPAAAAAYERVVALKRLLPDAARDKRRLDMFLREAKLAKLLDHPNVVRAFDYGEIDGELFLAMEYVEGQSLSRVLKALADEKGELGTSLAAHVLAEVCEGLHAAHELRDEGGQPLNLVHRDVSPQNVMLGYDGHVRLLDFGVAKIEAESVTKTGEVKGKTAYMSPEQAMGDEIDRRSDLFGVGAVLFECLALRRMWGDGTDMDVIRKLALEKPPLLAEAVPSAPASLCALYTRLVAREAKERPATAHDVAEELRELVPQGREEADRALRRLLESHFRDQAEEQRQKLTRSLEEVAPEQARELRESVIPEPATPPSVRSVRSVASAGSAGIPRARPSTASIADATGANPVSTGDAASTGVAGVEAATRESRRWPWLLAGALLLGGVGVWRATSGEPATGTTAGTATTTATAATTTGTATPATTAAGTATPATTAAGTAPATAGTATAATGAASGTATAGAASGSMPSSAAALGSARASLPALSARPLVPVGPSVAGARPGPPSSARPPGVSATATATATAPRPPPDVDDHPF